TNTFGISSSVGLVDERRHRRRAQLLPCSLVGDLLDRTGPGSTSAAPARAVSAGLWYNDVLFCQAAAEAAWNTLALMMRRRSAGARLARNPPDFSPSAASGS